MKHRWNVLAGWGSSRNNRLILRIALMIYLSRLGGSVGSGLALKVRVWCREADSTLRR